MIGTALKKYAEAHGMSCDGGYVYGKVNGRYIAMVDGSGVKMLQIYLHPPMMQVDGALKERIREILQSGSPREYRLIRRDAVNVDNGRAVVVFQDGPGAMKHLERYIEEVMPGLDALELSPDACACCGGALGDDGRHVLLDDYILPVHSDCAAKMSAQLDSIERAPKEGSVLRGALGALLGAVIGAIPWAIVYVLGYVAGIVGLLIGYLSNFFYGKLGGRNGRARVAIVVAALIVGVLLGQIGGVSAMFRQSFDDEGGYEAIGLTRSQFVQSCWDQYLCADQSVMLGRMYDRMISNVPEDDWGQYISRDEFVQTAWDSGYADNQTAAIKEFGVNLAMGLLFGVLGCLGLFSQLRKETRRRTVRQLK